MLTEKQFEGLKKVNLSVDTEKSRDRISSDFKEASADVKKRITELSGLNRATFYNAFQRGSASPKMVLAMSQLLGVSPYYYTGDSDIRGEFDDAVLNSFLEDKKLTVIGKAPAKKEASAKKAPATRKPAAKKPAAKKLATKKPATRRIAKTTNKSVETPKRARKAVSAAPVLDIPVEVPEEVANTASNNEVVMQISIEKTPKLEKAVANLDEETAVLLFRALIRKADASDKAKALCDVIKSCLLS